MKHALPTAVVVFILWAVYGWILFGWQMWLVGLGLFITGFIWNINRRIKRSRQREFERTIMLDPDEKLWIV